MAPLILNLDTRWVCVVRFTSRPLYPREKKLSVAIAGLEALKKRKIACSRRVQNHDSSVI